MYTCNSTDPNIHIGRAEYPRKMSTLYVRHTSIMGVPSAYFWASDGLKVGDNMYRPIKVPVWCHQAGANILAAHPCRMVHIPSVPHRCQVGRRIGVLYIFSILLGSGNTVLCATAKKSFELIELSTPFLVR